MDTNTQKILKYANMAFQINEETTGWFHLLILRQLTKHLEKQT